MNYNYCLLEIGEESYKLRLSTKSIVLLEKVLGCNPLMIFGAAGDRIPTITEMVSILHASLQQFHHGVNMNEAYALFDKYLEDGHTVTDFVPVIIDIFRFSGIIGKEVDEKN